MTSVEDKVRAALRGKADQVPPGVVPPLRLPARRRRPFSLAYGGGGRNRAPAWRGWLAAAACAAAVAAVAAGSVTVSHVLSGRQDASGQQSGVAAVSPGTRAARNQAAAWVAAQVSPLAVVACDPVMCRYLAGHGIRPGQLLELGPVSPFPLNSALIVATARVRGQFGGGLAAYAPAVLATFGSGAARVSIQVTAPHGAASYLTALRADVASRKASAAALSSGHRITFTAAAKKQVTAGQVDTRLIAIEGIAPLHPVVITAFRDAGPGASPGMPLRSADLAVPGGVVASSPYMRSVIRQLGTLAGPFRPAGVDLVRPAGGQWLLRIEFAAPSPLGLLGPG
jgi:hypothetical protein